MEEKNANPVKTPGVPENHFPEEQRESSEPMGRPGASRYRALAARLNFLSLDHPDLQSAAKLASRCMATPRVVDWTMLKRAARYLLGAPRAVQTFRWQTAPTTVTTCTDSDWARERASRKSTSGGVVCLGHHMMKSWGSTHSSGEEKMYALIKGASQTMAIISILMDFDLNLDGKVCTDASVAIGISCRRGLGRTRLLVVDPR